MRDVMNKIFKLASVAMFAVVVTGCATQEEIVAQQNRVAECKASGGKLDWDSHRIKRCVYPIIEDTLPVAYNTVPGVSKINRAR
jgi:hypothetical protein